MMDLWLRLQGFFDILFTRNVLTEIAAVALCLSAGGIVGALLRRRYQRLGIKTEAALTRSHFASHGVLVTAPVVVALVSVIPRRRH